MIAQQSAILIEKIRVREQAVEESQHVTAYIDRQSKLESFVNQLTPVFRTYKLLKTNHIGNFATIIPYMVEVKSTIINIRDQFLIQKHWGTESQVLTELHRKIKYLSESLDKHMKQAWAHHIDNNRPQIQVSLLNTLKGIPSFQENVTNILILLNNMENAKLALPVNQASINSIISIKEIIVNAWTNMGAANIPVEVQHFLQQATSANGVSLDSLTVPVREWLDQHRLTPHFSIRALSS